MPDWREFAKSYRTEFNSASTTLTTILLGLIVNYISTVSQKLSFVLLGLILLIASKILLKILIRRMDDHQPLLPMTSPGIPLDPISLPQSNNLSSFEREGPLRIQDQCTVGNSITADVDLISVVHTNENVTPLKKALQPDSQWHGSIVFHKRCEISPQKPDQLVNYVTTMMEAARHYDKRCSLQVGSFAIFKYIGEDLRWWRLQDSWTPSLSHIHRAWSLTGFLTGCCVKWTIKGLNLQTSSLKATTTEESKTLKTLRREIDGGMDVLICEESDLIRKSAPTFKETVYICASKVIEVEEGVSVTLQSKPINVKKAYWISVVDGLTPSLTTLIIMASVILVDLLCGWSLANQGAQGLFPSLALRYLGPENITTARNQLFGNLLLSNIWSVYLLFSIGVSFILVVWLQFPGYISSTGLKMGGTQRAKVALPKQCQRAMVARLKQFLKLSGHLTYRPRDPKPPPGIKMLNNHVWELCSPKKYGMEIIFFHGLQMGDFENAFWKTWLARDDERVVWPRDWLTERLPNARILSVSYDYSAMKLEGQFDMQALGENLVSDIIGDATYNIGQDCPIFLVGHSLGGIIIKQFLLSSMRPRRFSSDPSQTPVDRIGPFLNNVKGVFYYATPHKGSRIADLVAELPQRSPVLGLLKMVDIDKRWINKEFNALFKKLKEEFKIRSFAVAEGLPTVVKTSSSGVVLHEELVVEAASALADCDEFYIDTNANHITVCKATKEDHAVINNLTRFITSTMSATNLRGYGNSNYKFSSPSRSVEPPSSVITYDFIPDNTFYNLLPDAIFEKEIARR